MYCKEKKQENTQTKRRKKITMKKFKRDVKGITLIALVVTIIVLLILAGVALNLTIGQNGVFQRAQDAANTWRNAETNEQLALQEGADLIDSYLGYNSGATIVEAKSQNKFFKEDTTIKDDLNNEVRIPEGFKIANDSGTKVEDGIVIEDKDGNQFVWVPAKTGEGVTIHTTKGDKTIVYTRTDFQHQEDYSDYSEIISNDEKISINKNGGYYIGRFEAGDKESTESKTMRNEVSSQSNSITIKKGQAPYNFITYDDSKTLAEGMSQERKYKAITKLVSSYAWDTAINLIKIKNEDYGINSQQGNYKDTTFQYIDIEENEQTKEKGSNVLVPTGQTTAVSNIYDMGGNLYEYTTERRSGDYYSYVYRGGLYSYSYGYNPAGYRNSSLGNALSDIGFRVTLYCSTES